MLRVSLLLVSVLVIFGVGISKVWAAFHPDAPPPPPAPVVARVAPQNLPKQPTLGNQPPPPRGPYDLRSEVFVAASGDVLRTTEREYVYGEMCGLGIVTSIRGRCVKIQQPDGRTMYVVADQVSTTRDRERQSRPDSAQPAAVPDAIQPTPQRIAPERQTLSSQESARMARNLSASTRTAPVLQ